MIPTPKFCRISTQRNHSQTVGSHLTKLKYGRNPKNRNDYRLCSEKGEKVSIYLVQRGEYLHRSGQQILNLNQKSGFDYYFRTIPLFQENE